MFPRLRVVTHTHTHTHTHAYKGLVFITYVCLYVRNAVMDIPSAWV